MLQSRHYTNLYLFYLVPNKNLLVIDQVKRCSIKSLNSAIQNRNFRTRVQPAASSGLGTSANSNEKTKRFSILQLFNPYKDPQESIKKLLNQSRLDEDEKKQLKIAFAEGYLAASDKEGRKKHMMGRLMKFSLYLGLALYIYIALKEKVYSVMIGNTKHEITAEERIETTFKDALGVDEAKSELKDVVEFLKDPEKFSRLGARLPRGVLLVGPPGTGKTLLARAVAGEANVPFFHASGSEFDEVLVGQGARRIRDLFANAKSKAPCVIFIDEIDSVGGKRSKTIMHPYANQTINQLLSEMDGFRGNEGVMVLGATNRRDDLDVALLRPGRFDVEVRVRKPNLSGRKEILNHYLNKIKIADDVDVDKLSKTTVNFSGAELENMCNQAALRAAIDDQEAVSMKHLEYAKDKFVMGPAMKKKIPDAFTNKLTAYHEAGHTLVAWFTEDATPVHKVTMLSMGESLGHTAFIPEQDQYQQTKSQLMAMLDVKMGGRVAEEMIFGENKVTTGAFNDMTRATDVARRMVKYFGFSNQVGLAVHHNSKHFNEISNTTLESIESETKRLLQESYERAKKLLTAREKELHLLAQALLEHETLDKEQIEKVLNGEKLNLQE